MPFYEASHRSLRFQLSQHPLPALSRATIARSAPPSWLSSLRHLGPRADRTHCDLIECIQAATEADHCHKIVHTVLVMDGWMERKMDV